ncbi:MAG: pyridoxal phosphate-dependent aminotransferase [Atopobiaceae bacterium]
MSISDEGTSFMPLSLNSALSTLKPSGIRQFAQLAKATPGCISLTLGEPGETTPAPIRAEVAHSLEEGKTHYPPNNGTPALKEAISSYMAGRGLAFSPDQVIVTSGATEAIYTIMTTILEPGDDFIIPTPAFLLYDAIARICRANPVALDTAEDGFQIEKEKLSALVGPRTKAIILNSPLNPTGTVLTKKSLAAVAELAKAHDFYVICDNVYERLIYTDAFAGFAESYPELADRTIVVNSFSKPYAMTGWRLGWLAAPAPLMAALSMVHMYAISSVVSFTQDAAVAALASDVEPFRKSYETRRNITIAALEKMGMPCVVPEGAFYAFPSVAGFADTDGKEISAERFCIRAIKEAGVALVPGTCFGCAGHVRLSYATDTKTLEEGLKRLASFVAGLPRI